MHWLHGEAAPVATVYEAKGRDLVMELVVGPNGTVVAHGDLHPMNVILGPQGPVAIDWTNAGRTTAAFDAASSYVLMSTFETNGAVDRAGQRRPIGSELTRPHVTIGTPASLL